MDHDCASDSGHVAAALYSLASRSARSLSDIPVCAGTFLNSISLIVVVCNIRCRISWV